MSAQTSRTDQGIECIKKYRDFYYSREGGDLSSRDALAKAERTCAEQNDRPRRYRDQDDDRRDSKNDDSSGSPEAIASCMKKLMYERKLVCTRTEFSCSAFPREGFAGWQTQDVRTDISESAAVRACRNAR
ncbi:MAG: hypothetical protein NW214_10205 [Pseudanabaenaceae cyanobacterium bins.39]|nr:hypothetical protein [Pseudanabaenaceae cyanobacterium bins.39]